MEYTISINSHAFSDKKPIDSDSSLVNNCHLEIDEADCSERKSGIVNESSSLSQAQEAEAEDAAEVYLDFAGAAKPLPGQLEAVAQDLLKGPLLANPHSKNSASQRTARLVQEARERFFRHFVGSVKVGKNILKIHINFQNSAFFPHHPSRLCGGIHVGRHSGPETGG